MLDVHTVNSINQTFHSRAEENATNGSNKYLEETTNVLERLITSIVGKEMFDPEKTVFEIRADSDCTTIKNMKKSHLPKSLCVCVCVLSLIHI